MGVGICLTCIEDCGGDRLKKTASNIPRRFIDGFFSAVKESASKTFAVIPSPFLPPPTAVGMVGGFPRLLPGGLERVWFFFS